MVALTLPVGALDAGISVEPVLPGNQADPAKGYFDLIVQPGDEQELVLVVSNHSAFDVDVAVEAITASTGEDGLINYTAQPQLTEQTLQYGFAQLAEVPVERLSIPAGGSEQVSVVVHMPDEPLEGAVLGAIHIMQETAVEEGSLSHQFAYAIAVKLSDGGELPAPVFELGDVFFSPQEGRAAITTHIRNTAPAVVKEASIRATLYDMDGDTHILRTAEDIEMAPNSIFPMLVVDTLGAGLDPGDYRMEVVVNCVGEERTLESATITLTADQLKGLTYNRSFGWQMPAMLRMILWVVGVVVVVGLLAFLALLLHVRRENRKYESYMQQMNEKKRRREQQQSEWDNRKGGTTR